jgi:hypothetical protein
MTPSDGWDGALGLRADQGGVGVLAGMPAEPGRRVVVRPRGAEA